MPIAPEDRHRYPENWATEVVPSTLARAGLRCECVGECGLGHEGRCENRHLTPSVYSGSRVYLTVAHLNHTPEDADPAVLRAMCQGCHLFYDRAHHDQSRVERFQRALEAAGQDSLFEARVVTVRANPASMEEWSVPEWALPDVDARLREDVRIVSLLKMPPEVLAGLEAAIGLNATFEAGEAFVRTTLAAAITEARAHGAQVNHLELAVGHPKPWIARLLEKWGPGGASTPPSPEIPQKEEGVRARP